MTKKRKKKKEKKKLTIIGQIERDINNIFYYKLNFKYSWCEKLFLFLKNILSYFPYFIRIPTEYIIAKSLHTFTNPINIIIICIIFSYSKRVVMNNITPDSQGQTFSNYDKYEINIGFNPLQKLIGEPDLIREHDGPVNEADLAEFRDYYNMGAYDQYFDAYENMVK